MDLTSNQARLLAGEARRRVDAVTDPESRAALEAILTLLEMLAQAGTVTASALNMLIARAERG